MSMVGYDYTYLSEPQRYNTRRNFQRIRKHDNQFIDHQFSHTTALYHSSSVVTSLF